MSKEIAIWYALYPRTIHEVGCHPDISFTDKAFIPWQPWMRSTAGSPLSLCTGSVFDWRELPTKRLCSILERQPTSVTRLLWGLRDLAPSPHSAIQSSRGMDRLQPCGDYIRAHFSSGPISVSLTLPQCYSQEHAPIHFLHTNLCSGMFP